MLIEYVVQFCCLKFLVKEVHQLSMSNLCVPVQYRFVLNRLCTQTSALPDSFVLEIKQTCTFFVEVLHPIPFRKLIWVPSVKLKDVFCVFLIVCNYFLLLRIIFRTNLNQNFIYLINLCYCIVTCK